MSSPVGTGTMASELYRNKAGQIDIIIETILMSLVYASTGLRLWSRSLQRVPLQLNDYLILIATVLMSARYSCMVVVIVKCGVGLPIDEVMEIAGPEVLTVFLQILYVLDLLWVSLVSLIKVSILHFYLMVFRRQKPFRIAVYITMGICVSFWFGAFFGTAFFCTPPAQQWNPNLNGHCGHRKLLTSVPSSTDLGIDVIVIVLPMPILWSLQLPKVKKIALTFVFSLGFLIIGITAYRIKPMLELDENNITESASTIAVLASTVPLLGIINANLPILPPAFKKIFNSSALTTNKSLSSSADRHQFSVLQEPEMPLVSIQRKQQEQDQREMYS